MSYPSSESIARSVKFQRDLGPSSDLTLEIARDEKEELPDGNLDASASPDLSLNPTSLSSFKLYLVLLVAFTGSFSLGFDTTGDLHFCQCARVFLITSKVMNSVNGME